MPGTGAPADASTADVIVQFAVPPRRPPTAAASGGAAVGVHVLANVSASGAPFGGILTIVNFTDQVRAGLRAIDRDRASSKL